MGYWATLWDDGAAGTQRTGPRAETHREADVVASFMADFNMCRASQSSRPKAPLARCRQGIRIGVVGRDDRIAGGGAFGAFARRAHGNLLSSGNIQFVFRSRAGLSLYRRTGGLDFSENSFGGERPRHTIDRLLGLGRKERHHNPVRCAS